MVKLDLTQVNNVFRKKEHEYQEDVPEEEDVDASEFEDDDYVPVKTKNRRPKEDNFTQQRLASINPVFTPKSVLPIYLLVAAVFVIVGGCLLAQSSRVDEITMFYQDCVTAAPKDNFQDMPDDHSTTSSTTIRISIQSHSGDLWTIHRMTLMNVVPARSGSPPLLT